jgi:hypothetical protein
MERLDPDTCTLKSSWRPDAATQARAAELLGGVRRSLRQPSKPCRHIHDVHGQLALRDRNQMAAGNEAFHWAAIIVCK